MLVPKVAYCVITSDKPQHIKGANQNLIRTKPFVDFQIVVTDYLSPDNLSLLKEQNPTFIFAPFDEYPNGYRNKYIEKAKELGADYIIVFDTDELPDLQLCSELKSIIINNPQVNQFRVLQHQNLTNKGILDEGELSPYSDRWHKAVIFKLETWYTEPGAVEPVIPNNPRYNHKMEYEDWVILNLPDRYYFTHTKSANDVLTGAARDLFIGLGWAPELWTDYQVYQQFKELIPRDITDWPKFNQYLKEGNISQELQAFIEEHKNSKYTQFRSLYKYYFMLLHPDVPQDPFQYVPEKQSEAETITTQAYLEVFGRHPDEDGFKHYSKNLESGEFTKDRVFEILKASDEYVNNEINTNYVEKFGRMPTQYELDGWSSLMKSKDVTNIGKTLSMLAGSVLSLPNRIAYAQSCHTDNFSQALDNAVKAKPYVDEVILIYDQTLTITQIKEAKAKGITPSYNRWHDNFVEPRNYYLHLARQKSCGWILVSDPDETHDKHLLESLRLIINSANTGPNQSISVLQIRAHDISTDDDKGNTLPEPHVSIPDYWKGLLIRLTPEVRYEGVGEMKNVHEVLICNGSRVNLPDELFYEHKKTWKLDIWPHGARNFFIGGGGDNVGKQNPHWIEYRQHTDRLGIKTWQQLNEYFKKGNIDSEFKAWIIKNRDTNCHGWDSELREVGKYYFITLHPEENP